MSDMRMQKRQGSGASLSAISKRIMPFAACALIALLAEAFVFNANWWLGNKGYEELTPEITQVSSNLGSRDSSTACLLGPLTDEQAKRLPPASIPADASAWEQDTLSFGNAEISSVAFDAIVDGDGGRAGKMSIQVAMEDSGQARAAYAVSDIEVPAASSHFALPVQAYGYAKQIVLSAYSKSKGVRSIELGNVRINAHIPSSKSPLRVLCVLAFLLVAWACRPKSALWRMRYVDHVPRVSACCLLIAGALAAPFVWGYDDPAPRWGESASASDEYAYLARAIVDDGTLHLAEAPAEWLGEMDGLGDGDERLLGEDNVLDYTARNQARVEASDAEEGQDIVWDGATPSESAARHYKLDAAYHDGRYYVYFGVVPVMLAYIPYYLLTGEDLSNTAVCAVSLAVFALFSYLLLDLLVRRRFPRASCGVVGTGYVSFLLASCIIYTVSGPSFYDVPVVFALSLLAVGAYLLLRSSISKRARWRWSLSVLGAVCLALTLGCRPQVSLGALLACAAYLVWLIRNGSIDARSKALICSSCAIAGASVVLALGAYNCARFGSPLDFGANYNLTGNDMTLRGFHPERMVEGTLWYLFGVPHLSAVFPYLDAYLMSDMTAYPGKVVGEPFSFGVFIAYPFLFAIIAFAACSKMPAKERVAVGILVMAGIVVCAFDTEAAGIVMRYTQDFGYLIGAAFLAGWLFYERALAGGEDGDEPPAGRAPVNMDAMIAALVLCGIVSSLLIWCAWTALSGFPASGWLDAFDVREVLDPWTGSISRI